MPFETGMFRIFECQCCGDCCKGYGGTYVTESDIRAISAYIGVPEERFIEDFCTLSGQKPLLRQGENGYCIFWNRLCTIHAVKPRMCRAWPFLNSIIIDPTNWRIMADSCPGIRTDFTDETIVSTVQKELDEMKSCEKAE
jgi:uncharacterized protein